MQVHASLVSHLQDHIQEVLDKWNQIDDEIWAKVIVFERNRRVAKAYARAPVLTINGSNDGFDGFRYSTTRLLVTVTLLRRFHDVRVKRKKDNRRSSASASRKRSRFYLDKSGARCGIRSHSREQRTEISIVSMRILRSKVARARE